MSVKSINPLNFNQEITKSKKVVIDFYANWCGPCRMLSPILEEISNEIKEWNFFKVDVDQANDLSSEYKITSIPTILIFINGKLIKKIVGYLPKKQIIALLSQLNGN